LCTTIVAGGALYVRHPTRGPVTAIRVVSAGGYRPASIGRRPPSGATGDLLASAGSAPSPYNLVRDLRTGSGPSTTAPAKNGPAPQITAPPPTSTATTVPSLTPAPAPAAPSAQPSVATTPTTIPLAPLLAKIVPTAAAVLGLASWFDAPDGTCAHRDLPLGTVVKVTRPSTGASTTCRVSDRGPSLATNRVIDLSMDTFAKLASPDAGVIEVRIEW
jgi:hypothetical protein